MKDNDYQLALNYLIENIEMLNRHSDGAFCIPCWSKNRLQELVDKSKPMKPFYDSYVIGGMYHEMASCRNCGRLFKRYFNEHINYCPTGGQRLDWEDEEEATDGKIRK